MTALALSILLFVFWGVVGLAILGLLHTRRSLLRNMLLAPVVGVATTLLPIFWLNHAGIPIKRFAVPLTIVLVVISGLLLGWLRPVIPSRHYLPFAGILLFALFLTGRPMLIYGFDWASYCNDDMATYVLSADRILNHGFFDVPDVETLAGGWEYSQSLWFLSVVLGHRSGTEMILAWVTSLTGVAGPRIYMTLLMALHLTLISAAGGLVLQSRRFRLAALLTCTLLSLSALNSLGTLYQLMPQVAGISFLLCGTALLLRPFSEFHLWSAVRHGILTGLLVAAQFALYPEVSPFLFLAFVLYVAAGLLQRGLAVGKLMIGAGTAFITWVVLLNSYWLIAVGYIAGAVETSSRSVRVDPASEMMGTESLFPYFLVPGGLADFWGFQSIADFPSEPWMSASIALGAILFFLSIPVIAWQLWKRQPSAFVVFAMLVASVIFFRRHEGFALFKLSMFIQPFLLGTIATFWTALSRRKIWQVAPIVVLAMIGVHTQVFYVDASYKTARGKLIFAEIPQASLSRVYSEFEHAVSSANAQQLVLDTPNLVLSKVQTLYTRGKSTFNLGGIFNGYPLYPKSLFLDQATKDKVDSIARQLQARNRTLSFSLLDPSDPAARNPFVVFGNPAASGNGNECEHLIIAGRQHSVFNQSHPGGSGFVSQPCGNVRNHLVFVNSKLGQIHYFDSRDAAFYKPESDYFFADRYFSAVGRHLLFRVINPSEKVRLVLNLSRTLNGDGKNLLPPAAAVGSTREPFPLEGRGSGRVFSPPLQPQIIEGRAYLAIDLGVSGTRFPSARTGLMNLYGTGVQFDIRRPVAFARDISLISEEEYQRLTPPGRLQKFPDDLANPDLEYSGLYEDGWVSESAFVYLTQPEAADCLSIQGMTQAADTTIQILIDGRVIKNQRLTSGLFRLRIPVPRGKGKKRIELHFSEVNRLGEADSRPAAARLKSLGFEEASRREQAGASRLLPD